MSITRDMLIKIREEISQDPDKLGYSGKSDTEIAIILNSNFTKQRIVEEIVAPPINRILSGLGQGPNSITAADVAQAKVIS